MGVPATEETVAVKETGVPAVVVVVDAVSVVRVWAGLTVTGVAAEKEPALDVVSVIDRTERVGAGGQVEGERGYAADEGSGCVDCAVDEEADGAGWVGGAGDGGRGGEACSEGCGGDDSA